MHSIFNTLFTHGTFHQVYFSGAITKRPLSYKPDQPRFCKILENVCVNPCSPEGFSQTYFPNGGLLQPPLDYQY